MKWQLWPRVLTSLSIICCYQGQQGKPSLLYQIHFKICSVTISVVFSPAAVPEYLHVQDFIKPSFGHPV